MSSKNPDAPGWATRSQSEREALLKSIAETHPGFQLLRYEHFERFGMRTDTAVYACDGAEFVFVPGGTVTLGWDSFAAGMDEATRAELREALAEWEITDVDGYLRETMSPVRTVTVPPVLAEREVNAIGWRQVPPGSPELEKYQKDIAKNARYIRSHGGYELHNCCKMRKVDGEIVAYIYEVTPLAWLQSRLAGGGFSLPTEDEWEYLCGGGSRTLFRGATALIFA
ncbi:MAG: hypothetical protein LBJ11_06260 [Oscillospiraceae bacterium]|jgi:formylglycine-generating enzyme required for sulfatase activity|nr:hypothetical protein [Oscillospiraceae bacterium]